MCVEFLKFPYSWVSPPELSREMPETAALMKKVQKFQMSPTSGPINISKVVIRMTHATLMTSPGRNISSIR
jgi:hypothetical protein